MDEVRAKAAELEREVQEHYLTEAARDHFAARERLYSAAVKSSSDAIVTKSLDGTITAWIRRPSAFSAIRPRKPSARTST